MVPEVPGQIVDLEHFQARILQDALDQATIHYWLRRHAALSAALPRPGDFIGSATAEDLKAREEATRKTLGEIECHIQLLQDSYREPGAEVWNMVRA